MAILETIGKIFQQCLQTNTVREIIANAMNIFYGYKTYRSIACLVLSLILAAGAAVLFVLEPNTCAYLQDIVLKALPFLGNIASKIVVAMIGFWLGGALGFNIAKYISQAVSERVLGHSNSAYAISDDIVQRIINLNPAIYDLKGNIDSILSKTPHQEEVEQLKTLLENTRRDIDKFAKTNPVLHDMSKEALLAALQMSNLAPLLRLKAYNVVAKEVDKNLTEKLVTHIADVPYDFFGASPIKDNSKKDKGFIKVNINNQSDSEEDSLPSVTLKPQAVVFSNTKKIAKTINKEKHYPLKGRSQGSKPLDESKQMKLVYDLRRAHGRLSGTQQKEFDLIPDRFDDILKLKPIRRQSI